MELFKNNYKYISIVLFSTLTVFLFVPFNFYISNYSELELNFTMLFLSILIFSLLALIIFSLFYLSKSEKFKKILTTLLFIAGIFTYFESIFIMPFLGELDGRDFNIVPYIPLAIYELIFIIILFCCVFKFYKKDNFIINISKISLFFLLIQSIFFFIDIPKLYSAVKTENSVYENRINDSIYSFKFYSFDLSKYSVYSSKENVIILLMDCFGKGVFEEFLKKYPEDKELFKDFEYYPNATSLGGETSVAVPALFTGIESPATNIEEKYFTVLKENFSKENAFLKVLKRNGFNNYIYPFVSNKFYLNSDDIDNLKPNISCRGNIKVYGDLIGNTIAFYSLPIVAKGFSYRYLTRITLDKSSAYFDSEPYYIENDFYNKFKNGITLDDENKVFKYYHLRGLHEPYMLSDNFVVKDIKDEKIDPIEKTAKLYMIMLKNYFDALKKAGIYDKTALIIMSDHGSNKFISPLQNENEMTTNSLLLYKNFNTTQKKMKIIDNIYPDVADIQDLALYSAKITNKKWNLRYEQKCKQELKRARENNIKIYSGLELKKSDITYNPCVTIQSGISSYDFVGKSATIIIEAKKGVEGGSNYLILENDKNKYLTEIPSFAANWARIFYKIINFKANNVESGIYDVKLLVKKNGKDYIYQIDKKLIVKDDLSWSEDE